VQAHGVDSWRTFEARPDIKPLASSDPPRFNGAGDFFMRPVIVALCVLVGALSLFENSQASSERCETSKAGIKRCETVFHDPKNKSPDWKSIVYTDRKGGIVDFEVNFSRDVELVWPAVVVGMTMAILNDKSTKEERGALFQNLVANALGANTFYTTFKSGNYEWISGKNGATIIIRASRRK
jgi:hypothetical protein